MNKDQKIVLKYLKNVYRISFPIQAIGILYSGSALPESVKDAYFTLDGADEAQILIEFGKWVLKHA